MIQKTVTILRNFDDSEAMLCSTFCSWENCDQPKWICLNCGYVECNYCSDDWYNLVMLDEQFGDKYPCRRCKYYNSYDQFAEEWRTKKELLLKWDSDINDWRIDQSEWDKIHLEKNQ